MLPRPQPKKEKALVETGLLAASSENLGGNHTSQIRENWSQPTKWLRWLKPVRAPAWSGQEEKKQQICEGATLPPWKGDRTCFLTSLQLFVWIRDKRNQSNYADNKFEAASEVSPLVQELSWQLLFFVVKKIEGFISLDKTRIFILMRQNIPKWLWELKQTYDIQQWGTFPDSNSFICNLNTGLQVWFSKNVHEGQNQHEEMCFTMLLRSCKVPVITNRSEQLTSHHQRFPVNY